MEPEGSLPHSQAPAPVLILSPKAQSNSEALCNVVSFYS